MRDRRVHQRYDVSRLVELKGQTSAALIGEKLLTMSIGGCGFCASAESFKYKVGTRLVCKIWGHDKNTAVEIDGQILYITPHAMDGKVGKFYGVSFLPGQDEKISPVLDYLEILHQQGKVSSA